MSTVLALDIGTTSIAALAYDVAGRVLALRTCPNACDIPGLPADCHEQDPNAIRDRCSDLLSSLLADGAVRCSGVRSIALTGQMHGVVLIDGAGDPVTNLITWRDQRLRSEDIPESASFAGPTGWSADTGCRLAAGYGGVTLRWLGEQRGFPNGCTALTIADYLALSLCEVRATDTTHAASWGILNARTSTWHTEALKGLRIPQGILPEIREGGTPLGPLTAGAAVRFGLNGDVVVHTPIGDNQASVVGASGLKGDAIVLNLGTGGQVSIPMAEFAIHAGLETRPMPGGGYLLVGVSLCGGEAYAHLMRFFRQVVGEFTDYSIPETAVYARMNDLAAQAESRADGLSVDTCFAGTRLNASARGSIRGIGLGNWTPAHLTRALIEGMVRELAEQVPADVIDGHIDRVVAGGNAAARNPVVRQAIEAVFGRPCEIRNEPEEAALGTAMVAVRRGLP